MQTRQIARLLTLAVLVTGCEARDRARQDSLNAITVEQLQLTTQLSAQKDSLAKVIVDADDFIMAIDSQIRTVKGLPTSKRVSRKVESPIEQQLETRKEVLARVSALVERAKTTANQLAASRAREKALKSEMDETKEKLLATQQQLTEAEDRLTNDHTMIGELNATIERQTTRIAELELRVDSLIAESTVIAQNHYRAYYIMGTEEELLEKGIIQREGGANLIIAHPGRTLQPARTLDPALFNAIDQRATREIPLDSTKQYRVVSRQNLDKARVLHRENTTIRGPMRIDDSDRFWAGSRYLILVQR